MPFWKSERNFEKRKMKGGGYASTLEVNKDISYIIRHNVYNLDPTLIFTVTNVATNEKKEYRNIHYLGEGTYGKVFLVENDGKRYVIKLLSNYINSSLKEANLLNSFMNGINNKCKYLYVSDSYPYELIKHLKNFSLIPLKWTPDQIFNFIFKLKI